MRRREFLKLSGLSAIAAAVPGISAAATDGPPLILLETERFPDKGGWSVDQQFMDMMGAPFLLAHGMGHPVADATAQALLPEAGEWHVWIRTRNWAAEWTPKAPGRFQVALNGKPLPTVLGTNGKDWGWQKAGSLALPKGKVTVTLHDLTGFDARCDAIVLSRAAHPELPNTVETLDAFRRKHGSIQAPTQTETYDLVVIGAGIAGLCAAIASARLGLRVALVNDRARLGGCNSSEIRVHLGGRILVGPYPKLGSVVAEIGPARGGNAAPPERYEDDRKLAVVQAEPKLTLLSPYRLTAAAATDGHIETVTVRHTETGMERRLKAPRFVDATGDGTLGVLAGADFRYGRESRGETGEQRAPEKADRVVLGASVQWYSVPTESPCPFPDLDWALPFTQASCERVTMGEWTWETGMAWDQITEAERIRDYGLMVVYSNWAFLKNHSTHRADFERRRLGWVAYVMGKRESRRLMGDVVLSANDILSRRAFPDACCCTSWSIDLHAPDPKNARHFPDGPFKSIAIHTPIGAPYPIPYRCLYSRNVDNLFMVGRDISVTHVAHGTIRVMRTGGMMGEVVGMAAAICQRRGLSPRGVYEQALPDLQALMAKGVGSGTPQPPQRYNGG